MWYCTIAVLTHINLYFGKAKNDKPFSLILDSILNNMNNLLHLIQDLLSTTGIKKEPVKAPMAEKPSGAKFK